MTERSVRVRISAITSDLDRALDRSSARARAFANDLDTADSRMSNLVQTGLALGPALVPLTAAAVPAVAGLAAQLGVAAAAGGTALLAFNGVGTALDALNAAQLDPTAENIAKVREEFDKLGPAGQSFVVFLDDIQPRLQQLQDVAQAGLLPGVEDGIRELMDLMPQAKDLISELSTTSGDLFAEAGDNLNDPRWVRFFEFLEAEARPNLLALGRTVGNVTEGLANLLMTGDPLSDMFSEGLLEGARDFREWTANLGQTEGFEEFVDYIQRNGPQAGDTLGALANAALQLVQAAAPVGEVALPAIEGIADALAALANSPAGPVLIGAAAGVSALSRGLALFKAANASAVVGMLAGVSKNATKADNAARRMDFGVRAAASGIGVLALQMTDIDDKLGLANTATFAMLGAIAGPWGAAIGGGIGLARDFATANDDLADALREAGEAAANPLGFDEQRQAIAGVKDEVGQLVGRYDDAVGSLGAAINPLNDIPAKLKLVYGGATDELDAAKDRAFELTQELQNNQVALADFYHQLQTGRPAESTTAIMDDLKRIDQIAAELGPILDEIGIDPKVITGPTRKGWDEAMAAIRRYLQAQDSVPGRTQRVAQAFADLDSALASTENKADALATALDALLGPELEQDEALVAWKRALATLNDELREGRATLNANTKAGRDHRDSIRSRVEALLASVNADAKAGASAARLADKLRSGRRAIIAQAEAAGFSRKRVAAYLDTLNLTPKTVQTIFKALGISRAEQEARALRDHYNRLPKQVRTKIAALGADISRADVRRLQRQYELTPKQVRTIMRVLDRASGGINDVRIDLKDLDGSRANPRVDANTTPANRSIRAVEGSLRGLDRTTANPNANLVDRASRPINIVDALLAGLNRSSANPNANLDDQASSGIRGVQGLLNILDGQTATVTVRTREITTQVTNVLRNIVPGAGSAEGNLFESYDQGDVRDHHQPMIAAGGPIRVWAEPETKGEGYIPLADDYRRPRANDIWEEIGRRFGRTFEPMAHGGILGGVHHFDEGGFIGGSRRITSRYLEQQLGLVDDLPSLREYNRALRERARLLRDVRRERRQLRRERQRARDATRELRQAERALSRGRETKAEREAVRDARRAERQAQRDAEQAEKQLSRAKDRHAKAQRRVNDAVDEYASKQRAAIDAAEQTASGIMDAGGLFTGGFADVGFSGERIDRLIADTRRWRQVLRRLGRRGAAPWILQQILDEGPKPSVIAFGQELLDNPVELANLNTRVARLQQQSDRVGAMVAQPAFLQPWSERRVNRLAERPIESNVTVTAPPGMDADDLARATAERQRVSLSQLGVGR